MRTRGSPATRLTSRRPSGSATHAARSRWRTSTASRLPAVRSRPRSGRSSWTRRSRAGRRPSSPSRTAGRRGSRSRAGKYSLSYDPYYRPETTTETETDDGDEREARREAHLRGHDEDPVSGSPAPRELLTVDEALARILERALPLEAEVVPLQNAAGRVLAEPALARTDLPPFPSSAMDGFAVRAADTPGELPIAVARRGRSPVGRRARASARQRLSRRAARSRTVPTPSCRSSAWSNATVTSRFRTASSPRLTSGREEGTFERATIAVATGARLGPAQIGALAAVGVGEVGCARRPRVAIVATGTRAP